MGVFLSTRCVFLCVCSGMEDSDAGTTAGKTRDFTRRHSGESPDAGIRSVCLSVAVCMSAHDAASYKRPLLSGIVSVAVSVHLSAAWLEPIKNVCTICKACSVVSHVAYWLSVCLCLHASVHVSVGFSISLCLSVCLPVCIGLYVRQSRCQSVCVCVCLCVSVFVNQGSHASWQVLDFFLANSRT